MSTVIDVESGLSPLAPDIEIGEPRLPWYQPIVDFLQRNMTMFIILGGVFVFAVIFFWQSIFITIQSGDVGVLYKRFGGGTQTDRVLGEGIKVIAPWDKLFIYNVRVQEVKHGMQ